MADLVGNSEEQFSCDRLIANQMGDVSSAVLIT